MLPIFNSAVLSIPGAWSTGRRPLVGSSSICFLLFFYGLSFVQKDPMAIRNSVKRRTFASEPLSLQVSGSFVTGSSGLIDFISVSF
jgi:hypothetical protein